MQQEHVKHTSRFRSGATQWTTLPCWHKKVTKHTHSWIARPVDRLFLVRGCWSQLLEAILSKAVSFLAVSSPRSDRRAEAPPPQNCADHLRRYLCHAEET